MDKFILGPSGFVLEESLLLEARVYQHLSELLLFSVVLKPKMHGAFIWDCSASGTFIFVPGKLKLK